MTSLQAFGTTAPWNHLGGRRVIALLILCSVATFALDEGPSAFVNSECDTARIKGRMFCEGGADGSQETDMLMTTDECQATLEESTQKGMAYVKLTIALPRASSSRVPLPPGPQEALLSFSGAMSRLAPPNLDSFKWRAKMGCTWGGSSL